MIGLQYLIDELACNTEDASFTTSANDHLDEIEADLAADDEATTKNRNSGGAP